MLCKVEAKALAEVLSMLPPSRLFHKTTLETVGNAIAIRHFVGELSFNTTIPATVMEEGAISVDPNMLRNVLAASEGEVTLISKAAANQSNRCIVEANNGRSIYKLPVFSDSEQSHEEFINLDEACPFVIFDENTDIRKVLKKLSPFLGKYAPDCYFYFVPHDGKVRILAIQDAIAAAAEIPAEICSDTILCVPKEFAKLRLVSLSYIAKKDHTYAIGVFSSGYATAVTHDADQTVISRVNRICALLDHEASCVIDADLRFFSSLHKFLSTMRGKNSTMAKCVIDLESGTVYAIDLFDQNEIYRYAPVSCIKSNSAIPNRITFSSSLLRLALDFIPVPAVCEVIFSNIAILRLRLGEFALLLAAMRPEQIPQ